ncbi:hypothetical protein [Arthrobacter sp. UM1]|uniref:hypothetical protein n=1 Tax=Arthrobacter sp. UM1 TaxID=2766776 RepID=UPI001CF677DA|nr:hypothetical protein [Arthrobacter sp. UM1]MCB4209176.1 hypothetical protein [Arthrobacter sp. UM1]
MSNTLNGPRRHAYTPKPRTLQDAEDVYRWGFAVDRLEELFGDDASKVRGNQGDIDLLVYSPERLIGFGVSRGRVAARLERAELFRVLKGHERFVVKGDRVRNAGVESGVEPVSALQREYHGAELCPGGCRAHASQKVIGAALLEVYRELFPGKVKGAFHSSSCTCCCQNNRLVASKVQEEPAS